MKNSRDRRRPLLALAAAFAAAGASPARVSAADPSVTPITWRPCAADLVASDWTNALGSRLECGSMVAFLDENEPARGTLDVGLVRFKAGDPTRREGSIFFNFGGPGGNPLDFLPETGYLWSTRSLDHPLDGDKRRLADRYDLVAVIPRGLRGGTSMSCHYVPGVMSTLDPALYLADWNWAGFVSEGQAYARACGMSSLHPYVGTLQHVRDMEHARRAVGEPKLNFVGTSYGTWVGAFYAATYPTRTGRFVLDSVMNYAGTFEDQLFAYPAERQAQFVTHALKPAIARPAVYGLGNNKADVVERFRNMPVTARSAWASHVQTPQQLVAVLTMADWVRAQWDISSEQLVARARTHPFSNDLTVNERIRNDAVDLTDRYEGAVQPATQRAEALPEETSGPDEDIYAAVVCADTPWLKRKKVLRELAGLIGAYTPAADARPVMVGLICADWRSPTRRRPDIAELAKAPPMLLVQAESDPATPLNGARKALDASPGSRMVVARNAYTHGLIGLSETPCIEHSVGRFLLSGDLPDERMTRCDFIPTTPARETREVDSGPDESAVRAELARRFLRN